MAHKLQTQRPCVVLSLHHCHSGPFWKQSASNQAKYKKTTILRLNILIKVENQVVTRTVNIHPLVTLCQGLVEVLTAGQPYASRSLSSEITAMIPPFSGSRLDKYANCASASYGATTNSMSSDLRIWKITTWENQRSNYKITEIKGRWSTEFKQQRYKQMKCSMYVVVCNLSNLELLGANS